MWQVNTSSWDNWLFRQTKPIQTQFKPKQSQFWPNIKGVKAKTNPIQTQFTERGKNESFCVDNELYDCFNNATRGIYHPKGCQFKTNNQSSLITNHLEGKPNNQNAAAADRINFLLFFFLNPMVGYADKNVWKFCSNFVMSCKTKKMDVLFILTIGD